MGTSLAEQDAVGRVSVLVCHRIDLSFRFEPRLLAGYLYPFLTLIIDARTNFNYLAETKSIILVLKAK